ncbi:DUF3976 domain-containing protein [Bacillus sp. 22475]|jgi:hypothetical protein|uniref:DUF3976 domain-containing protein n=13 Tax=Bacillus cereus group TaxID=86661 RepID=A0A9X7BF92_BACCE|nr:MULTISPECIES: DUF3976 domain-containing protein [Bacillus]ANN31473.1 DUF3976 domain-containing protein [Bacillus thuringiensis serovar coreanensis]EAO54439.1 hypothetical protein RBTH_04649 [Bacillus thuringiensis serovar israelensis ATCC 35646]EEM42896.1 hypothetical protein bthur0004_11630 [Bacillus thuringiensis serovar sotto str. T04001]MCU7388599.1 DUF3976 domain-containing protein [Bacillus sp. ST24]MED1155362.1 DUF3976 domain-containing protein [Bacillus paranthracis]NIE89862.1 DUF3
MQMMYAFGIGLVLFLAVFLFIRKDVQGGTLTKRGFYKLIGCLVVMLIAIIVMIVLINQSL